MRFTSYAAASALATLATAQTFTDCNPMEKECPNNPAMPQNWNTDFTAGEKAVKGWKQTAGSLKYTSDGAEFTVAKKGDAPTIGSTSMLHFGYVEVVMKAAPGQGIISSIVLQSDNLDEVDWEWIGGQEGKVQMNYFGKGNTTTYDRMIEAPVATTQSEFHKYALNWTAEALTWIIDDKPVRTLKFADANGGKTYPQTPCNVRLGNWPGGDSENEGTRQWAGGEVDYKKAPFTMTVKSIKVINYSPGTEYKWTDKSGSFGSIQVIGAGNADGSPQNSAVIEASASLSAAHAPLASGVEAPKATGKSTSCHEGQQTTTPVATGSIKSTQAPVKGGQSNASISGPGPVPQTSAGASPCGCGTATVTVTGTPPATNTPSVQTSSLSTRISSVRVPIVSSVVPPPYPTSGIAIDTRSAPGIPVPTGSTPRPSGNATVSAPPAEFTGAASHNKAGALVLAVAGAVVLAF